MDGWRRRLLTGFFALPQSGFDQSAKNPLIFGCHWLTREA
jgi:hypothetical protein